MESVPQEFLEIIRRHSRPLEPLPTEVAPVLRRLPDVRVVLWDVYGTLFVSGSGEIGTGVREAKQQALVQVLQELDVQGDLSAAELLDCYEQEVRRRHALQQAQGEPYPEVQMPQVWCDVLGRLARQGRLSLPSQACRGDFWRRFSLEYEVRANPVWPMPGAESVLHHLHGLGILLGLVSNSQFYTPLLFPALLHRELAELGFEEELLFFSYRLGTAKPGCGLYQEAQRRLARRAIRPEQVLYVGNDMRNDILPAQQTGFLTALFAGDRRSYRPREESPCCREAVPTVRLTRLDQVLECVAGGGRSGAEVVT